MDSTCAAVPAEENDMLWCHWKVPEFGSEVQTAEFQMPTLGDHVYVGLSMTARHDQKLRRFVDVLFSRRVQRVARFLQAWLHLMSNSPGPDRMNNHPPKRHNSGIKRIAHLPHQSWQTPAHKTRTADCRDRERCDLRLNVGLAFMDC